MSVINLTPDSFSGDGLYMDEEKVVSEIQKYIDYGARIIDIGAESTAPQNAPISEDEEWARLEHILPSIFSFITHYNQIYALKDFPIRISFDSYKVSIWKKILESAKNYNFDFNRLIINDISGLSSFRSAHDISKEKIRIIKEYTDQYPGFQVCVMFDKNKTETHLTSENVIDEIIAFFTTIIQVFDQYHIAYKHLILDTGMGGFLSHNPDVSFVVINKLHIIRHFAERYAIKDIVIGTSRKTFLAPEKLPKERVSESVSSSIECIRNGANIIRIHDTKDLVHEIKKIFM